MSGDRINWNLDWRTDADEPYHVVSKVLFDDFKRWVLEYYQRMAPARSKSIDAFVKKVNQQLGTIMEYGKHGEVRGQFLPNPQQIVDYIKGKYG